MNLKLLAVYVPMLLIAIANQAYAGQSAEMVCTNNPCDRYELHVNITSEGDAGLPGAYGVIAIAGQPPNKSSNIAYWTEDNTWSPYSDNTLIKPTDDSLKKLKATRDLVVFRGRKEELCRLSNGHSFNLFAWHVGLKADQIRKTQLFLDKFQITGWQAENFWNSVLFYEANKQKKVGWVYSQTCSVTN